MNAQVLGRSLTFLLDIASAVCIIGERKFNRHSSTAQIPLRVSLKQLLDCSRPQIIVLGCFKAKTTVETKSAGILFYVAPQGKTLRGWDATDLLKLIIIII